VQVFESAEHLAIRNLHPPKGRRFQEKIASICSERPMQAKNTRSLFQVSPSAQNIFFLFMCKSLKLQNISQSEIFTLRRAGGFSRASLPSVRKDRRKQCSEN
jgi:hypothetical protein